MEETPPPPPSPMPPPSPAAPQQRSSSLSSSSSSLARVPPPAPVLPSLEHPPSSSGLTIQARMTLPPSIPSFVPPGPPSIPPSVPPSLPPPPPPPPSATSAEVPIIPGTITITRIIKNAPADDNEGEDVDNEEDVDIGPGSICRCIFLTLHHPTFSPLAQVIAMFMGATIVVSCLSFVFSTMPRFEYQPATCRAPSCTPGPNSDCTRMICHPTPHRQFFWVEAVTVGIFTVEYLMRMFTVHCVPHRLIYPKSFLHGKNAGDTTEPSGLSKTMNYGVRGMNIIDLLSILPFFLMLQYEIGEEKLIFLRLLRLVRVIRIFKLGRYTDGSSLLRETLRASSAAVGLMAFFMIVLTLLFASIVYFAEMGKFKVTPDFPDGNYFRRNVHGGQEELSPFTSIPVAAYWVIMTATTVGFGDFYPTSTLGRFVAVFAAYLGIVGIALPSTIIGKSFIEIYFRVLDERKAEQRMLAKEKERGVERRRAQAGGGGGGGGCGGYFGGAPKPNGGNEGGNEGGKAASKNYTEAKPPGAEPQQEEEQTKGGGGGGGGGWQNFYMNRDNSVARMIQRREKQIAAEKVEEEALVHEIEAQLTATQEADEGREAGMLPRGRSKGYSPAPRATSMPGSGGNTPSGYMLASIHQAGHGAVQAAAALQAIPLARKVRRQQQQIKELTHIVREQLHQIQALTETLGEMERATVQLIGKLDEIEDQE